VLATVVLWFKYISNDYFAMMLIGAVQGVAAGLLAMVYVDESPLYLLKTG